jgi:hypothetical protein
VPLSFKCPQCGKSYENVGDQFAGKRMKCKCGKVMRLGGATPAAEQPAPIKATPVKPVPVQPIQVKPIAPAPAPAPVAPAPTAPVQPLTPINEVADPIFGTGQKIDSAPAPTPAPTGGTDDLFGGLEPPPPANPYGTNAAYAPPAPITRPNQPRRTKRRKHKSSTGPVMSIISGALGTIYGLVCLAFFGLALIAFVTAVGSAKVTPPPQALFSGISTLVMTLLAMAMTGGCGYSAVTGIMELTNEYRNPGPSSMAGTACIAFTIVTFLLFIVGIIMAVALQADVGRVRYNEGNAVGMVIGFVIAFIILLFFLAIPIFVFCVGHFRNRK